MSDSSSTPATSTHYHALLAAAPMIGDNCVEQNKQFVACKMEDRNPEKCLSEGEKVTACVLKTIRQAESKCNDTFLSFQSCLTQKSRFMDMCEEQQKAFEACMGYEH
mmetsp:Transcript_8717/g.15296  ORF Transcript_8717/g.15296 Transcript_8717/m.15296 type:complete len:107 (-) Transcript_8717:50-370(-)